MLILLCHHFEWILSKNEVLSKPVYSNHFFAVKIVRNQWLEKTMKITHNVIFSQWPFILHFVPRIKHLYRNCDYSFTCNNHSADFPLLL